MPRVREETETGGSGWPGLEAVVAILAVTWWLAIYLPGAGSGLIKDDFAWIGQNQVHALRDVLSVFGRNNGFYRPVVALSFAADHAVFGLAPLGFGLTNLCLALLAALSIARLARALGLPPVAAVIAAAVWSLNPHGINMAVLWTSGRTALFLTLFTTLAATAWIRERLIQAALWTLLALLSKEEAVVLPFVLLGWSFIRPGRSGDSLLGLRRAAAVFVPLVVYLVLRAGSGAFTPVSAPPYYRFSTDWRLLTLNSVSYLDRAASYPVVVALIGTVVARRLPRWDAETRRLVVMGLLWMLAGFALTVWIPVRSSLYACLPSVGSALGAAAWLAAAFSARRPLSPLPMVIAVLLVAVISTPLYWARNERWLRPARASASVMAQLPGVLSGQPEGTALVIHDRPDARDNLAAAFGTALPDAVRLASGRPDVTVWLEPPPGDWQLAGWRRPPENGRRVTTVWNGTVLRRTSQ